MSSLMNKKTFIIFLLTVSGLAVHLNAQPLRTLHEKTFKVNEGELLEIQSDVGDIDIKTWYEKEVYIKIFGDDDAEEDVDFRIEKTSGGVLIDAEKESGWNWGWNNIRLKYEIKVPENFDVDISTGGGNISLLDLNGRALLKTSGGDIYVENTMGNLDAKTSGGDLELYEIAGNINAKTSGGNIDIQSSNGFIDATTSGGNIDVFYNGVNNGIKVTTSGGNINVSVPSDFKADVYLKTSGGRVNCQLEARIKEAGENKFIGTLEGGGPELTCKTSGGNVTVRELK